jgi:hypothetical protein
MNSRRYMGKNVAMSVITGILLVSVTGVVAANEGMEHGNMHRDEAMVKQHQIMALYPQVQWKINESQGLPGRI